MLLSAHALMAVAAAAAAADKRSVALEGENLPAAARAAAGCNDSAAAALEVAVAEALGERDVALAVDDGAPAPAAAWLVVPALAQKVPLGHRPTRAHSAAPARAARPGSPQ